MTGHAPPPMFVADHPALDFLNTVGAPFDEDIEWLGSGEALLEWLEAAGLLPHKQAVSCRKNFSKKELDKAAAEAISLREWFRQFLMEQAEYERWNFEENDMKRINEILQSGQYQFQLETKKTILNAQDSPLGLRGDCQIRKAEDLLFPIALKVAEFLSSAHHEDTRKCAGETCTLWFVDVTKNKKRRWCDMKICGNRAKAAAFRARKAKD
jgi:predicted RNA-binding Zn ribbon-like protein